MTLGDSSDVQVGRDRRTRQLDRHRRRPSVSEGTVTGVETISVGDRSNGDTERLSGDRDRHGAGTWGFRRTDVQRRRRGDQDQHRGRRRPGLSRRDREPYAVAIDSAETIADQIRSGDGDAVQIGIRGFLGVEVDSRSDNASGVDGAVIAGVLDGTPARTMPACRPRTSSPASTASGSTLATGSAPASTAFSRGTR